jgi:hypothetical protein
VAKFLPPLGPEASAEEIYERVLQARWVVGTTLEKRRDGTFYTDRAKVVAVVADPGASGPPRWEVHGDLRLINGQLVLVSLTFKARPPGVTSGMLREVRLGAILDAARRELLELIPALDALPDPPDNEFTRASRALAAKIQPGDLRRGRRGYPDDHYRRIAFDYLALQQERGTSRGLLEALAEKVRTEESTPARETIRDWVHEARRRGFLSPTTPGRGGATPGPNLYIDKEEGES